VVVLDAPIEAIWTALYDIESHPSKLGNVSHSTILSQSAQSRDVFQRIDLPIVSDRYWMVQQHHNSALYAASNGLAWEVTAHSINGALPDAAAEWTEGSIPIAWSKTGWLFLRLDPDTTLAEYWVWTDPGGRLPAGLVSRFAPGAMKGMFDKLQTYAQEVEAAGRATPTPPG
jgi:hypothetical protein